jgi:eukaryotic-like serine/threonine-protein kinase
MTERTIIIMTLLAFSTSCWNPGTATPTERATAAPMAKPTEEIPPEGPSLGDTTTRPSDGMVMVYVPAGEFEMGNTEIPLEDPAHTVALDSFWIDRTEVSNVQFQRCVKAGVCDEPSCWRDRDLIRNNSDFNGLEQPVMCVDWHQARAYCEWAGGRLPTEAEWEYTARGPEGLEYPWGNEFDGTKLNYCDVNCPKIYADERFDDGYAFTAPVGSYPDGASWCGALDMAGNVREWAADWFGEYASGRQVNPTGPSSGIQRAMRGGAWEGLLFDTRNTVRKGGRPIFELLYLGFRCASSVSP